MSKPDARARRQLELIAEYMRTGSETAFLELQQTVHGLIGMMINRYSGSGVPVDELSAEANIGLMLAIRDFDPERGPFAAAVATCVNRVLYACVHRMGRSTARPVSRQERKLQIHGGRLYRECLDYGIPASVAVDLVAESLGYEPLHVVDAMTLQHGGDWSLDDDVLGGELAGAEPDADEVVAAHERSQLLEDLLGELPEDQARIIRIRQLVDIEDRLPWRRIEEELGMCRWSVTRREREAMAALREGIVRRGLKFEDLI